ncbi:MAG: nucleotide exchange factor GrpE [Prevotella sp.]|nr:nucleotide exchange factor GrpE [Prevotella sp.]MDY6093145.1 nucleotide exchange factor GrpE [Prevotella sp.]
MKETNNTKETMEQNNAPQEEQQKTVDNTPQEENNDGQEKQTEEPQEEKDPLLVAQEQIEELKDKYLRAAAEFDNYRKRTLKEKAELILNGGEKTITAILPILDDMERAIENGKKTDDPQVIRDGMELILTKFIKTLEGQGVKKIDTTEAVFDTDLHEAIAMVPGMGDEKKGKVLDCIQAGYMLNDKVIRHAKVAVGA